MRRPAVLTLAFAAAAMPAAAKEPIPPPDPALAAWRQQAVAACVAADPPRSLFDTREQVDVPTGCGCAVDYVMQGRGAEELPRIEPGNVKNELNFGFLYCRAMSGVRDLNNAAKATEQMARDGEAAAQAGREDPLVGPVNPPERPRAGLFEGLDLPGWLIFVLPALLLGVALFEFIRRSGRGRSRDLIAPPPSMRPDGPPEPSGPRPNDVIS